MTVSTPINVYVEIEDLTTGCTYLYHGEKIIDCINYFQSLFFYFRPYKIINSGIVQTGGI